MRRFLARPLVRLVAIVAAFIGAEVLQAKFLLLGRTLETWTSLAVLVAIVLVVEWFLGGRRPREIGFDPKHLGRDVALGLIAGAVIFSTVIGEMAAGGAYRIAGVHAGAALLAAALWLVPAAAIEEIFVRGVIFRLLADAAGTWIALALSAALFGAIHLRNPGATWYTAFAIAVEAGILLAAAYIVTGNLWFPIALHFAWNFCEGPIYGTQLSGLTIAQPLFTARVSGPDWLTGGSFGPEAGVPALVNATLVAAALLVVAYRNGAILPVPWRKATAR